MNEDIKPGDLIVVRGRWRANHVGVVAPVAHYGEQVMVVYESTSAGRPPCVRDHRQDPVGVQAHFLDTILSLGDVWHYPLRRPLYFHEEDRLLYTLDMCLGRDYAQFTGRFGLIRRLALRLRAKEKLAGLFCAELVAHAWNMTGFFLPTRVWTPARLLRYALRRGLVGAGKQIS